MQWTVCGLFAWTMLAAYPSAAQDGARVRAIDPVIIQLIARGIERSATFRELVAVINASDTYVYVKEGSCASSVRACLVSVSAAGSVRFVWVKVNLRANETERLSRLGHELRHALEVIEQPTVRDNDSMFFLYKRIGTHVAGATIETTAAMAAEHRIRDELLDFDRRERE